MNNDIQNIYHEKQRRFFCALHTLNNLFQRKEFSDEEIEDLAKRLRDDHKVHSKIFFLGYYDVNFIEFALFQRGYVMRWLKNSREQILSAPYDKCTGLIVNTLETSWSSQLLSYIGYDRRHWFSIVKINHQYYNLDSKLPKPILIGSHKDLTAYLEYILSKPNNFVILVYKETDKSIFESQ